MIAQPRRQMLSRRLVETQFNLLPIAAHTQYTFAEWQNDNVDKGEVIAVACDSAFCRNAAWRRQ